MTVTVVVGNPKPASRTLTAARLVEPAMMLVVSIAYAGVPRDVGLRLLARPQAAEGAG